METLKALDTIGNNIYSKYRRCGQCLHLNRPLCWQNTVYVMFRRAKTPVVMVRLHTLSSWLPKQKGFARRYARESCYGFRVTSEVTIVYSYDLFLKSCLLSLSFSALFGRLCTKSWLIRFLRQISRLNVQLVSEVVILSLSWILTPWWISWIIWWHISHWYAC